MNYEQLFEGTHACDGCRQEHKADHYGSNIGVIELGELEYKICIGSQGPKKSCYMKLISGQLDKQGNKKGLCLGCGRPVLFSQSYMPGICSDCERLIEEAQHQRQILRERSGDQVKVRLWGGLVPHILGSCFEGPGMADYGGSDVHLMHLLHQLSCQNVAELLRVSRSNGAWRNAPLKDGADVGDDGRAGWSIQFNVFPHQLQVIQEIHRQLQSLAEKMSQDVDRARAEGRQQGSDILSKLALGQASTAEFDAVCSGRDPEKAR